MSKPGQYEDSRLERLLEIAWLVALISVSRGDQLDLEAVTS